MGLLKGAPTTPVGGGETDQHQISPGTASGGAPPEQQREQPATGTLPATDAAIAALQGSKYNPNQPPTPSLPPTAPQYVMSSPPAPRTLEPLETWAKNPSQPPRSPPGPIDACQPPRVWGVGTRGLAFGPT